jgi:hypothetical protein
MPMLRPVGLFLLTCYLTGVVAAQPDTSAVLEKAKTKFEKDIAKLDETFLSGIDKTMVKALSANNKALHEKLTYEREQFVGNRILPTAYSSESYHKQRNQAITALMSAYQPVINDLTKAKKFAELNAIEDELNDLLKTSRGYGLAFSADLDNRPIFMLENKSNGEVLTPLEMTGQTTQIIVAPKEKEGKKKLMQCWRVERYEQKFAFRNLGNQRVLELRNTNSASNFGLGVTPAGKDPRASALFQISELRHEMIIECSFDHRVLTATEKKEKGVTTIYVTDDKKEKTPTDAQLWTLVEVK